MQRRLDEATIPQLRASRAGGAEATEARWESDEVLEVVAACDGCCNGIAFWFEVRFTPFALPPRPPYRT